MGLSTTLGLVAVVVLANGFFVATEFAIVTALHIVLGELASKGVSLQRPEGTTLWITRPILLFEAAFHWSIKALNGVGNGVLKLFGLEPAAGHETVHTVDERRLLVSATQRAGLRGIARSHRGSTVHRRLLPRRQQRVRRRAA